MEKVKKKFIGSRMRVRKPVHAVVVIEDSPDYYDYYKSLGLDIFETVKTRVKKEKFPKHEPKNTEESE